MRFGPIHCLAAEELQGSGSTSWVNPGSEAGSVIDEYARECLALEVERSMTGAGQVR